MKMSKLLLSGLFLGAFAVNANATPISGSSLQDGLDALTDGGAFYDVNTQQNAIDETWKIGASGAAINRLVFEIASFANVNKFGIYDTKNIGNTLEIFNGASCGLADGCVGANTLEIVDLGSGIQFSTLLNSPESAVFSSNVFGYYLETPEGTWYSQTVLNGDGVDHMVAFAGDGALQMDLTGGNSYSSFLQNNFILAWDDQNGANSDNDYSDFVVMVESVYPVPEPSVLALLGLSLFGIGLAKPRRRKVAA